MTTATRRRCSLSPSSQGRYWRSWAAVCVHMGWKNSDSSRRYALHLEAQCPKSMKDFAPGDFDRYLDYCSGLLGKSRDSEREKMIWRIRKDAKDAGLTAEYLIRLSRDLTGLGCWEELSKDDLENFRNTVHNRAYSLAPEHVDFIPGKRKFTEPDFSPHPF